MKTSIILAFATWNGSRTKMTAVCWLVLNVLCLESDYVQEYNPKCKRPGRALLSAVNFPSPGSGWGKGV